MLIEINYSAPEKCEYCKFNFSGSGDFGNTFVKFCLLTEELEKDMRASCPFLKEENVEFLIEQKSTGFLPEVDTLFSMPLEFPSEEEAEKFASDMAKTTFESYRDYYSFDEEVSPETIVELTATKV